MPGPKLIKDFPSASGLSSSLLIAVGDPNTGVLYKTTLGDLNIGTQSFGTEGPQGFQGRQGFQGFQGFQGKQGFQGFQGDQGFQGPAGSSTASGVQGAQGLQGTQGLIGTTGSQGFQGFQGFQGRQGFQGVGATGLQGVAGATGVGFVQNLIYTLFTTSPTYSLLTGPFVIGTTGLVEVNIVGIDSSTGYDFISGKKVVRYFYSNSGTFSVGPISDLLPTERSGGFTGATWSIISNGLSSVLVRLIGTATASVKWIVDYKYVQVTGDF